MRRESISIILLLLMCDIGNAEIYKWVDEQGNVQFSQTPPNEHAEKVVIKNSSVNDTENPNTVNSVQSNTLAKERRYSDFLKQERLDRKEKKTQEKQQQAEVNARCERIRANYNELKAGGRFYEENAQGDRVFLSDEQIQKTQEELKQILDRSCRSK